MKKSKLLSAFTSLALVGSVFAGTLSTTASAVDSVNLTLSMTSEKTNYTLEEIQAGATARIYVEAGGEFQEDNIAALGFKFNCSNWDVVPVNIEVSYPNQFANNNGDALSSFYYKATYGDWTKDFPIDPENGKRKISYAIAAGIDINEGNPPGVQLQTSMLHGYFSQGSGTSIAEFDVEFPTTLEEGTYTINFTNVDMPVAIDDKGNMESAGSLVKTSGITFTVSDAPASDLSVSVDDSALDADGNNANWYFEDEAAFDTSAITVMNGSEDVTADAEIDFGGATPESTYDGTNFDYSVPFTVTYNGSTAEGTMDVKIGQRGDANCDHSLNTRDAAAIARDLAQVFGSQTTTLTGEDGFALFLANVNEDVTAEGKETAYYGSRNINARDAALIARYLSMKFSDENLKLVDLI